MVAKTFPGFAGHLKLPRESSKSKIWPKFFGWEVNPIWNPNWSLKSELPVQGPPQCATNKGALKE